LPHQKATGLREKLEACQPSRRWTNTLIYMMELLSNIQRGFLKREVFNISNDQQQGSRNVLNLLIKFIRS
jgi:hypothetical protein